MAAAVLLALAQPSSACAESSESAALRESENPISTQGSKYDYRSIVTGVAPAESGLR